MTGRAWVMTEPHTVVGPDGSDVPLVAGDPCPVWAFVQVPEHKTALVEVPGA